MWPSSTGECATCCYHLSRESLSDQFHLAKRACSPVKTASLLLLDKMCDTEEVLLMHRQYCVKNELRRMIISYSIKLS